MKFLFVLVSVLLLVAVSGCTTLPSMGLPVFDSRQRVMIFAAHQDDEAIGAAAIMSRVIENGGNVSVVITTDGAPEEFGHGDFEAGVRKNETLRAMALLGIQEDDVVFLDYDDLGFITEIDTDQEIERIASIIREENPTQVYVQAYEGGHIDHDATHYLTLKAVENSGLSPRVYEFPEYNAFGWGESVPDESDVIDNDRYPVITLNLTDEEKQLKKDVLKQYVSQHPFKKNLISQEPTEDILKIALLEISADARVLSPEELKNESKYNYLKLATADYRPTWNYNEQKPLILNRSEMTFLTEFGKFLLNIENPTFRQKTDFVLANYDFRKNPEDILIPENTTECRHNIETYEDCMKTYSWRICSTYLESYYRCIDSMDVFPRFVNDSYGGDIPEDVWEDYKLGSYYIHVNISEPFYGGVIESSPKAMLEILLGIGNYDEVHTLNNVTLELKYNIRGRSYMISTYTIGDISPRSILFDHIVFRISHLFSGVDWLRENEPVELALILRGIDDGGENHTNHLFFTLNPVRSANDLKIRFIMKMENTIHVWSDNYGLIDHDYFYVFRIDDIGYAYRSEILRAGMDEINIEEFDFNASMHPNGTYDSVLELYVYDDGTETLADVLNLKIRIGDDEDDDFGFSYFGKFRGIRPNEFTHMISQIPNKFQTSMENCEEDDYLICLFYWPDMIREVPEYNYTQPPHTQPPALGYEKYYQALNMTMDFDDFRNSLL